MGEWWPKARLWARGANRPWEEEFLEKEPGMMVLKEWQRLIAGGDEHFEQYLRFWFGLLQRSR